MKYYLMAIGLAHIVSVTCFEPCSSRGHNGEFGDHPPVGAIAEYYSDGDIKINCPFAKDRGEGCSVGSETGDNISKSCPYNGEWKK
jgi:hypothetical protein